ncbi:MAG: hypothetical protein AB7G93_01075 [Bdellovibrionales bacterium]
MKKTLKEIAIEKLKQPGYEDHALPVSRRDFIKLGLLAGGGAVLPLSLTERVLAQMTGVVRIPFLVFDLAGGAGMPANFLVGQEGGPEDLCNDYRRHGWNPRASGALDKTFGIPMAAGGVSKMLEGLKANLPQALTNEAQRSLKMASFCHFSLDDTSTNRASALTLVSRCGLQGSFLRAGLGLQSTLSGGNSDAYLSDSKFKPQMIRNLDELTRITSFGATFEELDPHTRKAIFNNLKGLAGESSQLKEVYEELSTFGVAEPKLDPRNNAQMNELYQLQNSSIDSPQALQAGIVYNTLMGNTGPGVITFSNCDYHDNTQTTGDAKDLEIGVAIGRAVHAAHLLKKPLFYQIITDGGVYAPGSDNYDRRWVGDRNQHSLTVVGYFDPNRDVELRRAQVGRYTPNAEVDQKTFIGDKPEKMVPAVLANYLHVQGLSGQIEAISGIRLQNSELDKMLVFA